MRLAPLLPSLDNYQLVNLASGRAGLLQTVGQMREYVNIGKVTPAVRNCALRIVYNVPQRNYFAECEALFNFVRDNIRYTRDVLGVETVAMADKTLQSEQGDCDDQTVLLCALVESIGCPTRFVVAGYNTATAYEHVFAQLFIDGHWVSADPTEPHELGWEPPNPLCVGFEKV